MVAEGVDGGVVGGPEGDAALQVVAFVPEEGEAPVAVAPPPRYLLAADAASHCGGSGRMRDGRDSAPESLSRAGVPFTPRGPFETGAGGPWSIVAAGRGVGWARRLLSLRSWPCVH